MNTRAHAFSLPGNNAPFRVGNQHRWYRDSITALTAASIGDSDRARASLTDAQILGGFLATVRLNLVTHFCPLVEARKRDSEPAGRFSSESRALRAQPVFARPMETAASPSTCSPKHNVRARIFDSLWQQMLGTPLPAPARCQKKRNKPRRGCNVHRSKHRGSDA